MVTQSLDDMLKDQIFLGRGVRYFTAALDIDLAPPTPASTSPSTRPAFVTPANTTSLYFTTDDGKSYFPLEATNKPPFMHEGKFAYRAHVFSTDGGKTGWVGYISKFSPISAEALIRRPGETAWTPVSSPGRW